MELPSSMHGLAEPIKVEEGRLIINSKMMLPYKLYRFRFLNTDMVACLELNPDRVDIYEEVVRRFT